MLPSDGAQFSVYAAHLGTDARSRIDLFEARAVLLGRLGRHDSALELYVYRLHDFDRAERYAVRGPVYEATLDLSTQIRYCKQLYQPDSETRNIFLILLRIYLRPLVKTTEDLLRPALDLIARHGPRLDSEETLQLLPPLVSAHDVRIFLAGALRIPRFDTRVVRGIAEARGDQVARKLMYLEANRVKITDSRMYAFGCAHTYDKCLRDCSSSCPQCHKRIGPSAIVVHAPG
jgi:Vam6/Vps39-like protein vacuolar protein sorting-associated protein 39